MESDVDLVLSTHCWPSVFYALLEWQRKFALRAVQNKTPHTRHLFLERIYKVFSLSPLSARVPLTPTPLPVASACARPRVSSQHATGDGH